MTTKFMSRAAACAAVWLLVACGGGGGSGGSAPPPAPVNSSVSLLAIAPTEPVPGGGSAQLAVSITNSGSVAATGLVFTPNLATGLTLTSLGCTGSGGGACPAATTGTSFALPDLPAKASLSLTLNVKVAAGSSGALTSMPAVQAGNDAVASDNTAAASIKAYSADVGISGSGPTAPVPAGSTTAYTMTVSNAGPDEARDVQITNTLGNAQTLGTLSCSASGGATCPTAIGPAMRVPLLPKGGALVFTVQATVAGGFSGGIANVMQASAAGDPLDTNNATGVQLTAYAPATGPAPAGQTTVALQSDNGDYIGAGRSYSYSRATANVNVSADGARLQVQVAGDDNWNAQFQLPAGFNSFAPGTYNGLRRFPEAGSGGVDWGGNGRGCNQITGSMVVNSVTYVDGQLSAIDFSFEQHCEGQAPALRGQVRWFASDTTAPAGPLNPPPDTLWAPPASALPASGNYVYLTSDSGDYIGGGATVTHTQADAILDVTAAGGRATVRVTGDQNWRGEFQGMQGLNTLQAGQYGSLRRYPFHNPVRGGLDWSGNGAGCNTLTGWFVVDRATYIDGALTALDLRFEQHCEGATAALRGKVHWEAGDRTAPPGPLQPPPVGLWAPASGATPTSGSYVYLTSDSGDYIGGGRTTAYTRRDAVLGVNLSGRKLTVSVTGDESWTGTFEGMNSLTDLQPGYYGKLQRHPFHNPTRGGMDWSGQGRGCNRLTGWFVVDKVSVSGGQLTALDLRFEQHCEGGTAALRGQIHWDASDLGQPAGPVNPPPAGLWLPGAGSTPASGSYVYLTSDSTDIIGNGGTYTYTPANATLGVTSNGRRISVTVNGDRTWTGEFQAMDGLAQLQPGYYGGLQRYPFHNVAKGGMSWAGTGSCGTLSGWFAIDNISFVNNQLVALDLRFEQRCNGGTAALRGRVRWAP
ncbi:hypothetical protein ACG04Q_01235 [Roseateles sp. DXS20W]|uniref:DUF11 domain-containing protein n=1 Tax=Pelomonas lactea TaxID=3299030 RepID=A0ABW7GE01_9BURK